MGVIGGITSENIYQDASVDKVTNSLKSITTDHAAVHRGEAFSISGIFSDVANGATVSYAFKTPASGKIIHLKFREIQATGNKIRVDLYQNPTNEPAAGIDLTAYNRNRNSTKTTTMQAVKVNTVADLTGAEMIDTAQFISGNSRSLDLEWNLKPNTWYVRTFTNSTGAAADINFFELWYEEDY